MDRDSVTNVTKVLKNGLQNPSFMESALQTRWEANPITSQLVANRMWLPVNLVIVMFGIAVPFLIIRFSKEDYVRCTLVFPVVHGIIRLSACIWNYSLII
jgi:hypothetical protein